MAGGLSLIHISYFIYKRLNKNIPNANGGSVLASENVFVVPLPDVETNL